MDKNCTNCDVVFKVRRKPRESQKEFFCSRKCRDLKNRKPETDKVCPVCGITHHVAPAWIKLNKNDSFCCSRACKAKFVRKPNKIIIEGDVAKVIIEHKKYGTLECLVSAVRISQISTRKWHAVFCEKTNTFYAKDNDNLAMHRLLLNPQSGFDVDHIDHNGLNNTDENLRLCTRSENNQNQLKAHSRNKSTGIRNVYRVKDRLIVRMVAYGKLMILGSFPNTQQGLKDAEAKAIEGRKLYMPYSTI